jgi:hypothetical protein
VKASGPEVLSVGRISFILLSTMLLSVLDCLLLTWHDCFEIRLENTFHRSMYRHPMSSYIKFGKHRNVLMRFQSISKALAVIHYMINFDRLTALCEAQHVFLSSLACKLPTALCLSPNAQLGTEELMQPERTHIWIGIYKSKCPKLGYNLALRF